MLILNKKIVLLLLVFSLCFNCFGCSNKTTDKNIDTVVELTEETFPLDSGDNIIIESTENIESSETETISQDLILSEENIPSEIISSEKNSEEISETTTKTEISS